MLVTVALASMLLLASPSLEKGMRTEGLRTGRQASGGTTVVSCKVFRKGVCNTNSKNIITVNKWITNSFNCQQQCYATPGCAAFTFFDDESDKSRDVSRKCVLFKDCNGKLGTCKNCLSGPIMPRVNECLAARQETEPTPIEDDSGTRKSCDFGCAAVCVGPLCSDLLPENQTRILGSMNKTDFAPTPEVFPDSRVGTSDQDTSAQPNDQDPLDTGLDNTFQYDETPGEDVGQEAEYDYLDDKEYDSPTDSGDGEGFDQSFDYESESPVNNSDVNTNSEDIPLDEEALNEDEDVDADDINIDSGFLNDNDGAPVDLAPRSSDVPRKTTTGSATFFFMFCAFGGVNSGGTIAAVDILTSALTRLVQTLSVPTVPSRLTSRGQKLTAAYTGMSVTTCSSGYTLLSPYGYLYKPGTCSDYQILGNRWGDSAARLTTFRNGGSMSKLGRYLMATGGYQGTRAVRSIELFDPQRPQKGWQQSARMTLPSAVSDHCTVSLKGGRGRKEIVLTGGRGTEQRVLKYDIKLRRWYSLNDLNIGRKNHACVKATINGRPGVVVSGGLDQHGGNTSSVEFYDALTGSWLNLPPLRKARSNHAMVINKGKLVVAGGMAGDKNSKDFLDDIEIFTGSRWLTLQQRLDQPRADFSLVKVPSRSGKSLSPPTTRRTGARRPQKRTRDKKLRQQAGRTRQSDRRPRQ